MHEKIVFVYNANSGVLNAVKDYVHKLVKPGTYPCSLCAVSFGAAGMKPKWKAFISSLPMQIEFMHKDEFHHEHGEGNHEFPAAYAIEEDGSPSILIPREQIDAVATVEQLQALTMQAIAAFDGEFKPAARGNAGNNEPL